MKYSIREKIGINGITFQDGQKVYDEIYPKLISRQIVELDFSGVKIATSPFLNAAIGQLFLNFTSDDLSNYLKFKNTSTTVDFTLNLIINSAKKYYGNELIRVAIDSAVSEEVLKQSG